LPESQLKSALVDVGKLRLHHTYGGAGRPIVFVHGLGSSGYIEWRFTLPRFARSHRVFAPDLPGFGRSDKPRGESYGIPFFARTLDRYVEGRRLKGVDLVGTSMGGRVALEIALKYPERVRRLVLVDALGLGRPSVQFYYPLMLLPRVGETVLGGMREALRWAPGPLIRRVASRYIGARGDLEKTMDDDYLRDLREMYQERGYPEAYLATVRSMANFRWMVGELDVARKLEGLKVPLLIIWGANDPLFPVEQAIRAHGRLPGSRLVVIEGAGHTPQAERPDEFNRHLAGFLKNSA